MSLLCVHHVVIAFLVYLFSNLVLHEYWVLTESRLLLELVPGGVRIVALSISSNEQTQ